MLFLSTTTATAATATTTTTTTTKTTTFNDHESVKVLWAWWTTNRDDGRHQTKEEKFIHRIKNKIKKRIKELNVKPYKRQSTTLPRFMVIHS